MLKSKLFHTILALLFSSTLIAGDDDPFYYAWGLTYQYNSVKCENAFIEYGGGGFYSPSYELSRADANFGTKNIGFNIEGVFKKGFVQASTSILRISGQVKDSANARGFGGEPVNARFGFGPSIGNFGFHIGLYCKYIKNGIAYAGKYSEGYYYGNPGNFGVRYFDKLYTWEGGFLLGAIYQINETMGIRASWNIGKIKNQKRRIDGVGKEFEAKFYATFLKDVRNYGFYVSYRFNSYVVKGINEDVISNGNSGSVRQPATKWIQNTFAIGINIPIVFKG